MLLWVLLVCAAWVILRAAVRRLQTPPEPRVGVSVAGSGSGSGGWVAVAMNPNSLDPEDKGDVEAARQALGELHLLRFSHLRRLQKMAWAFEQGSRAAGKPVVPPPAVRLRQWDEYAQGWKAYEADVTTGLQALEDRMRVGKTRSLMYWRQFLGMAMIQVRLCQLVHRVCTDLLPQALQGAMHASGAPGAGMAAPATALPTALVPDQGPGAPQVPQVPQVPPVGVPQAQLPEPVGPPPSPEVIASLRPWGDLHRTPEPDPAQEPSALDKAREELWDMAWEAPVAVAQWLLHRVRLSEARRAGLNEDLWAVVRVPDGFRNGFAQPAPPVPEPKEPSGPGAHPGAEPFDEIVLEGGLNWRGTPKCNPDEDMDFTFAWPLCYPKCKSGYVGVGPLCWKQL